MEDRMFMRHSSRELSPVRGEQSYEPAFAPTSYERPPYYDHGYDNRSAPAPVRDYMGMPPNLDPGYARGAPYNSLGSGPQRSPPRHLPAQPASIDDAAVSDLLETLEDIEKANIPAGYPPAGPVPVGGPFHPSYPPDVYDMRSQAPPYRR